MQLHRELETVEHGRQRAMLGSVQSLLGPIRLASGGNLHLTTDGISTHPEQSIAQNSEDAEAGPSALYGLEAKRNHSRRNDCLKCCNFFVLVHFGKPFTSVSFFFF